MKVIQCFARAIIFLVAYSSCTKFVLDETEKDVQVIEKIIEDLREVQPPRLPEEDSPKQYEEILNHIPLSANT